MIYSFSWLLLNSIVHYVHWSNVNKVVEYTETSAWPNEIEMFCRRITHWSRSNSRTREKLPTTTTHDLKICPKAKQSLNTARTGSLRVGRWRQRMIKRWGGKSCYMKESEWGRARETAIAALIPKHVRSGQAAVDTLEKIFRTMLFDCASDQTKSPNLDKGCKKQIVSDQILICNRSDTNSAVFPSSRWHKPHTALLQTGRHTAPPLTCWTQLDVLNS